MNVHNTILLVYTLQCTSHSENRIFTLEIYQRCILLFLEILEEKPVFSVIEGGHT